MDISKKKITDLIDLLSPRDVRNLKRFISSPYHIKPGEDTIYLALLELIIRQKKTAGKHTEEHIFSMIYPKKRFVSGKVDKKISQLHDVVVEFLGYEKIKAGKAISLYALKVIRERGAAKLFSKEHHKMSRRFGKQKGDVLIDELMRFEIDLEEFKYLNMDAFKASQTSYDTIYDALDRLYIIYYLEIGIRNLAYNRFIIPLDLKSRFDTLIQLLKQRKDQDKSPFQLFQEQVFNLLSESAPVEQFHIQDLAIQLEGVKDNINIEAYKKYRIIIRNFTVARYNYGDTSLAPVLFDLYKKEIKDRVIFFEDKIPSAVVNNITIVALRENEVEWLEEFLKEITGKILEPNLEGFTLALNRGKLLFAQARYDEVLDLLIYDVKEIYLKVYARILELMSYFELNSDQLSHKLEAYKLFIYRMPKSKVWEDFITGHNNFIRLLKSISHPSTAHDLNRIQKLERKIQETKILAEKPWLLEKVNALAEKNN